MLSKMLLDFVSVSEELSLPLESKSGVKKCFDWNLVAGLICQKLFVSKNYQLPGKHILSLGFDSRVGFWCRALFWHRNKI